MNAELKKGSSFTWQSIWAGINTLKRGHIWHVGDGTNIDIWKDEWIPNSASRKVITRRGQNIFSRVSDLIDPITNHWDVDLVRQPFWQVDVQRILAVPLSSSAMQDFVAWNLTRTNTFSVRSAYYA